MLKERSFSIILIGILSIEQQLGFVRLFLDTLEITQLLLEG